PILRNNISYPRYIKNSRAKNLFSELHNLYNFNKGFAKIATRVNTRIIQTYPIPFKKRNVSIISEDENG
ncbi:MAG: hypothetical protein ACYT04_94215, partial [Nostoc sp.]